MLKKYHVGEYISNYMDVLELSDTQLSRLSGISRNHIINIKNKNAALNVTTAIAIAPFLNVPPSLLMNLQTSFISYSQKISFLEKNQLHNINPEIIKLLENSNLSSKTFEIFKENQQKYIQDYGIVHYMPSKANDAKNFLLIQLLSSLGQSENPLDISKIKEYISNDYIKMVNTVKDEDGAVTFFKTVIKDLNQWGINLNIINTNLNTTIKGVSKIGQDNVNILIENSGDFANIVWYLTHEIMHLFLLDAPNQNHLEEQVNKLVASLLVGDYYGMLDELNIEDFNYDFGSSVNKFLLYKQWSYYKRIFDDKYKISIGGDHDFYS